MGELVSLDAERIRRRRAGEDTTAADFGTQIEDAFQMTRTHAEDLDQRNATTLWSTTASIGGQVTMREIEQPAAGIAPLSFDGLYPHKELLAQPLKQLIAMLDDAISLIDTALFNIDEGDGLAAELVMQNCESVMAGVFALEPQTDNTAMVAQAIFYSIHNKGEDRFSRKEIVEIRHVLHRWKNHIFLNSETMLSLIEALESVGLSTEPKSFLTLRQMLSDEGIS